ncbi:Serine/threonine-protein kinase [Mucor circinelloides]
MVESDFTGDLKLAELHLKETPTQIFKYRKGEYNPHANLDQIENDNTQDTVN